VITWLVLLLAFAAGPTGCAQRDPLPSWNESASKRAITSFVAHVTRPGSSDFVPPAERIAVFDNDGTLCCEQPTYVLRVFTIDRVRKLAPQHPQWASTEPFKSVLAATANGSDQNVSAVAQTTPAKDMLEMVAASGAGAEVEAFEHDAREFLRTSRHPAYHRPYGELMYQPMLELLAYLRASGFKTFVVTGGGVDFVRALAADHYGIPPEQVIGVAAELRLEKRASDGREVIVRGGKLAAPLDGAAKPLAIQEHIGRRPILAVGNSDGDLQMLQYTATGPGPRLAVLVHHTDDVREVAYDRASRVGKLDQALDEAQARGWTVIDMKEDWKTIFPMK
jgi:phosphoserine phosphatase